MLPNTFTCAFTPGHSVRYIVWLIVNTRTNIVGHRHCCLFHCMLCLSVGPLLVPSSPQESHVGRCQARNRPKAGCTLPWATEHRLEGFFEGASAPFENKGKGAPAVRGHKLATITGSTVRSPLSALRMEVRTPKSPEKLKMGPKKAENV